MVSKGTSYESHTFVDDTQSFKPVVIAPPVVAPDSKESVTEDLAKCMLLLQDKQRSWRKPQIKCSQSQGAPNTPQQVQARPVISSSCCQPDQPSLETQNTGSDAPGYYTQNHESAGSCVCYLCLLQPLYLLISVCCTSSYARQNNLSDDLPPWELPPLDAYQDAFIATDSSSDAPMPMTSSPARIRKIDSVQPMAPVVPSSI